MDELKGWIHKFLEFTTTQTSDSFYGLVWSRLCESRQECFESLHIPPLQLFCDFSRILAMRTDGRNPSRAVLKQSIEELNSLVGLQSRYCVCPIYDKVPLKVSPEIMSIFLKSNLASDLIQFRERCDRFLGDYMDFLKALDRKLSDPLEPRPFGYHFERPKPLALSNKKEAVV